MTSVGLAIVELITMVMHCLSGLTPQAKHVEGAVSHMEPHMVDSGRLSLPLLVVPREPFLSDEVRSQRDGPLRYHRNRVFTARAMPWLLF